MSKRSHYIAVGLVLALILALLSLPAQTAARLKLAAGSLFLPLFGLAASSQQIGDRAADALTPRAQLLKENEELRRQNQQLRLEAVHTREVAQENARLRQQLGWQQRAGFKVKLAKVILRDPANWWRTIQIDRGSADGIRTDCPVMTIEGLIGRVSAVGPNRSQVVLLGDPTCKVAAMIENDARDQGIIGPSGPFDGSLLELSHLNRNAMIKPDQNVMTSGEGGIFPKGIPVGKIVDSQPVEYGLYLEARVKLAANLGSLEEVWVLTP